MTTLLDARHVVASAAGSIAQVSGQISRALAWEGRADHAAALVSDLETALTNLRIADRQLQEAITRVRVATEGAG